MVSTVSSSLYCKACGAANSLQATHCSACHEPLTAAPAAGAPATNPLTGLLLPNVLLKQRYRILDVLTTGEGYTIYKTEDVQLGNRIVALNELGQSHPSTYVEEEPGSSRPPLAGGLGDGEAATEASRRELLLQAGLVHPNLPRIYDSFMENKRWYFVMDLLAGETLEEYLRKRRGKGLPLEEVVDIGIQLSTVLEYLHGRPLPLGLNELRLSNIMRAPDGNLTLLDVGTPSQSISTPADAPMHSLGTLLRQLQRPGRSLRPSRSPLLRRPRRHPHASAVEQLIKQMTLKDVSKRPANMAIVRQELQHLAAQGSSSPTAARWKFSRRTLLKMGRTGVLMVVSAGVAWLIDTLLHQRGQTQQNPYSSGPGGTIYTYTDMPANGWLLALAWSPDGRRIAVSGPDPRLQIWDANTGKHLLYAAGHSKTVEVISWSAQNNLIASGSDDFTVRIWDGASGKSRRVYRGHSSPVLGVAWSPDGRYIASGAIHEPVVQVWEAATGLQIVSYSGHAAGVGSVAWSPDGRYIASASFDSTVQVWEAATGRNIFTFEKHTDKVYTVAWSPDGKYLASGGEDQTVRVWTSPLTGDAGKPPPGWEGVYTGYTAPVEIVAWSPNGTTIAAGSDDHHTNNTIRVWNGLTGKTFLIYERHSNGVFALGWSPNGRYIASASKDGTAQVWNS